MRFILIGSMLFAASLAWFSMQQAPLPTEPASPASPEAAAPDVPTAGPPPASIATVPVGTTPDAIPAEVQPATRALPRGDVPTPPDLETLIHDPDWDRSDIEALVNAFAPEQHDDVRDVLESFAAEEQLSLN